MAWTCEDGGIWSSTINKGETAEGYIVAKLYKTENKNVENGDSPKNRRELGQSHKRTGAFKRTANDKYYNYITNCSNLLQFVFFIDRII